MTPQPANGIAARHEHSLVTIMAQEPGDRQVANFAAITGFLALFSVVVIALWGLPYYYDFMVREFGWTRAQVASGNAALLRP